MAGTVGEQPRTRRDARRNHERLVAAALAVFSEQGVEASLEQIAHRAGVGIGTLYRHFPTRDDLVEAIFERRVGELVAVADEAAADPDGWRAFCAFLERTLELQAEDRVLKDVLLRHPPRAGRLAAAREALRRRYEQLIAGARANGALRGDFTSGDLALLLWSFRPVMDATAGIAPGAWRRHLHFVLDGLRAEAATPHSQRALADDELRGALTALAESQRRR